MPIDRLNYRQRMFVEYYLGSAGGNGQDAAEMAGYASPKERVDLRVPVYVTDECSVIAKITCSVDVDPSEGKLRLLPLPDAINSARSWALAQLANAICLDLTDAGLDSTPAVYRGQP